MLGDENIEIIYSHTYKALNKIFRKHKLFYGILQFMSRFYNKL